MSGKTYAPLEKNEENNEKTSEKFEDNNPVPTDFAWQSLKGRCLSNLVSAQDLSAEWVFQRAVNKTMQRFKDSDWYFLRVDGNSLQHTFPAGALVAVAALLSPIIFPIVYGCAVIALTLGSPFTFYKLRTSFTKKKLQRGTPKFPQDCREVEVDKKDAGPRFEWWSIMYMTIGCIWHFVCGTVPWLVIITGEYGCLVEAKDEYMKIHTSPIIVFGPWAACAMAAFRYAHQIHVSACDCACESANNRMLLNERFGKAMETVVNKLSAKDDPTSFYPIFVSSEVEEPPNPPFSMIVRILLALGAFLHGLLPQVWMAVKYEEPFPPSPFNCDRIPLFIIWLGIIAPAIQVRYFLSDFADANLEFEECAKQLLIFRSFSSKRSQRKRDATVSAFQEVQAYALETRPRDEVKEKAKTNEGVCWGMCVQQTKEEHSVQEDAKKLKQELKEYPEELVDLSMYQVGFNFSTKEGIILYRRMRTWLCTDILNERLEVEWYVTIAVQICFLFTFILGIGYVQMHKMTAMWTVFPLDILVLSYLIMRGLNTCVTVNEYLFDDCTRILLDWLDEVGVQTNYPKDVPGEKLFAQAGWIWNKAKNMPEALPLLMHPTSSQDQPSSERIDQRFNEIEVARLLDTTIKRIEHIEEKQKILGLEVTPSLRNRIAASLGSVLVAVAAKVPAMINAHYEEIQVAMNVLGNVTAAVKNHTFHES